MTAARLVLFCAAAAIAAAAQAAPSGYHITDRIAGPDGGWDYASYDAGRDRGLIRWQENGAWKQEGYWGGGRAGRRGMTIELGGGWDHDFSRD